MFLAQAADVAGLNAMTTDMIMAGRLYEGRSFQLGLSIFAVLSLAGAAMYFWRYADQHGGSLHGIEAGLFGMVKAIAIPLTIMLAIGTFLSHIVPTATALAGDITGQPRAATGPAGILITGILLAVKLVQQPLTMFKASLPAADFGPIGAMSGLNVTADAVALTQHSGLLAIAALATIIAALVAIFVVLPCFSFICLQYIVAIANIAIVLSIGTFQVGWSAAPGTSPMAERFYGAVNSGVMRIITILVLVAFIQTTIGLWGTAIIPPVNGKIDLLALVISWMKLAAGSIILAGLAGKLPQIAAESLGGAPSVAAGDAMTAGRSAANRAGAVVNAGASAVKGAVGLSRRA